MVLAIAGLCFAFVISSCKDFSFEDKEPQRHFLETQGYSSDIQKVKRHPKRW